MRLVLEEGEKENGACSSVLSWESIRFQDGKMGTIVKNQDRGMRPFESLQEPMLFNSKICSLETPEMF